MAESLRDQLSEALDTVTTSEEQTPNPGAGADAPVASEQTAASSEPDKPGRTAGRERDEKGRLLPGKAQRDSAQDTGKPATPNQPVEQSPAAAPVADPKPRPQRPSTWKKDFWGHWDKLDPSLAEYLVQRESEFAKGVSTYKSEADKGKAYIDAVAPFLPTLQQYGIEPTKHIQALFNAHQLLALGNPEQRLGMFLRLARDYQVPVEQLFVRGQDGQIYFNSALQQHQAQPQVNMEQIEQRIASAIQQRESQANVSSFGNTKDAQGNPKYPHFEQVRETMAQLLEAKLADDLEGAYNAAVRMPQHSDIWDAMQKQQREADERRQAEERQRLALKARSQAVSPRSQPTTGTTGNAKPTGLRANLEAAFDEHASRV